MESYDNESGTNCQRAGNLSLLEIIQELAKANRDHSLYLYEKVPTANRNHYETVQLRKLNLGMFEPQQAKH